MALPFLNLSTHINDLDTYDHYHHDHFNYIEPQSSFSSSTSSLSTPIFLSPPQIQGQIYDHYYREPQSFQFELLEADRVVSYRGSCGHDHQTLESGSDEKGAMINLGIDPKHEVDDDQRDHENRSCFRDENIEVKWMSSKMKIMRKMTYPDQAISSHNFLDHEQKLQPSSPMGNNSSNNMNPIRVCSDCNTTKTPLWRSGPRGPKSLCNACGIRQRKARRAMAAAAALANGTTLTVEAAPSVIKTSNKVKLKDNKVIPFKKRCHKFAISPSPQVKSKSTKRRFQGLSISNINENSSTDFQRVFPQDEKEGAILLMALSCGLVRG